MLQIINNHSVRGQYFTVTVPDIHKVEYTEAGKLAIIGIEGEKNKPGQVDWVVYVRTFSGWLSPHEFEEISADKRKQILDNVSQALSLLGMPHQMVET